MFQINAIIFLILCHPLLAISAEFKVSESFVIVSGRLGEREGEIEIFKKVISENKKITTILFNDSLGGTAVAAKEYVEIIKTNKFNTRIKGSCHSACAIAFLSGKSRNFVSDFGVHIMMLHGVSSMSKKRNTITKSSSELSREILTLIEELTDHKIAPILPLIEKYWLPDAGIVFTRKNYYFYKKNESFECVGAQGKNLSDCKKIELDPYGLGILTVIEN